MSVTHTVIDSPIGELTLVARDGVLTGVYFPGHTRLPNPAAFGQRVDTGFEASVQQLGEYFRGERTQFDLPLAPHGSEFQLRVWSLLREIPYGETRSYGQLAKELGNPLLAREVGGANARNPLSIVVPCHRVVGADGRLVGYAGGLERKQFLLDLEAPAARGQLLIGGLIQQTGA
ncbi:MAG TPA: methylated-DNA--[protein]-cysteine S-methyltransferase [Gemmatimonadaceae bacterium]|nr:methylated-DNA--[protein]-cysteine S-methyltransferase [Gemmatimonadaceae bacterium]